MTEGKWKKQYEEVSAYQAKLEWLQGKLNKIFGKQEFEPNVTSKKLYITIVDKKTKPWADEGRKNSRMNAGH